MSEPARWRPVSPESGQFEEGETVNIKATPSSEYEFFSWSGVNSANSSASVVMDSDKTITALFTKDILLLYLLRVKER